MYKELQGTESNLLAYYKFNQGVAFGTNTNLNTVFDATANGLNGSLMGSALSGSSSNWVVCKTDIPDGYLIKASKTNNITPPANGTVVTDDNNLSDGIGAVNVLAGVQTYNGWTNFTDTTSYYYKVYPYSNSGTSRVYNTSVPVPAVKDSVGIDEFKEITTSIPALVQGKSRWADYDNDGDMDVLIYGGNTFNYGNINNCITKFYKQNADHSFSEVLAGFVNVADGDAAWGDYNNDGLLDLIITGGSSYLSNGVISSATTKLYKQNADHTFTLQSSMPFENLLKSSVAWGDYDNDGDLDLLLTGKSLDIVVNLFVKIYRNNGNNTFTPQHQINLESIYNGSVAWGDYDKDGYLDIIMAGNSNKGLITKIYRNNKNNYFFEQTDFTLPGINFGNALWGDYDNDGDLDILINGKTSAGAITSIFKNSFPTNAFAEVVNLDIPGIYNGVAQWGDINKDGKIDILIGGTDNSTSITNITEIYFQNSEATFSRYSDMTFKTGSKGSIELVDYDNDRDLDFFITGYNTYDGTTFSTLYQNNHLLSINNQKPTAPVSLNAKSINDYTILSWDKVTTDNTPSLGLSYNLRVGTSSGTFDIASPMSDTSSSSGFRRVASIGNCQQNNFKVFKLEPGKTYYWNVQAIDNSYIGGNFSEKSSFFVDSIPASGLNFLRISDTEYKVKWTRGNGNRCVVFCRADSSINNATPSMGTKYVHNSKFTYGDPIQSTDWFCVYNGLEDSVVISGLSANTAFTVQVIEYVFDASGTPKYVRKKSPKNDDWGIFNTSLHTLIPNTFIEGSIGQWADFNNDGFIDYVVTGNNKSSSREFSIGLNNGNNTFTISRPFYYYYQNVLVADFDNDGAQEIFYTARDLDETTPIVAIYDFYASPTIKYITNMQTFDYRMDYSYLCDYNKDGYIDIVRKGIKNNVSYNTIFYNNGDNTFTEGESNLDIPKTIYFEYTADYDNDGDVDNLDYLGVKQNNSIIKTGNYSANRFPSTPVNLSSQNNEGDVIIKWDAILTDETPQSLMTYDVRIRKVGDSEWYNNPLIAENGYRRTVTLGKYKTNTATLSLPLGSYEWQVQAIDQGYQSSGWSALNTFTTTSFFTADTVCLGDSTSFTDHSAMVEGQATWLWDFGDNTYSNKKNPKHKFTTPGKHVVNLSVNSYSFSDTVIVNDTLKVEFVAEDVCAGLATTIKNNTQTNGYTQWQWDFGDNTPISTNGDLDSHSFPQLGSYTVSLTATDANGCSAMAIKRIVVTTTPNATLSLEYGNPSFCKGDSVTYSVPFNTNYTYNWYHNNQIITEKSNALKVKTQSGDYKVEVVNNLSNTCKAISDVKTITVKDAPTIPVITPESNTTFCFGDSVKINAGDLSGVTYQWYRNLGQLTSNSNYIVAKESGNYTLTTSFNNGCSSKHSLPIVVTTNVKPSIPSVSYGETTICEGENVSISVINNTTLNYQWYNNNQPILGATSNIFNASQSGNYKLLLTNASNYCSAYTDPIAVTVNPVPTTPFIEQPATNSFCNGDSILLQTTAQDGMDWLINGVSTGNSSNMFYAKTSGEYSIRVINTDLCEALSSNSVNLTMNPTPALPTVSAGETTICEGENVSISVANNTNLNYQWYNNNQPVSGATNNIILATLGGNYKLQLTNASNCSVFTDPIAVNVNPTPTSPFIEQPTSNSFCSGDSILLQTSAQDGLEWLLNGIATNQHNNTFHAKGSGTYTVRAVNEYQCEALSSNSIQLTMNPAPIAPAVSYGNTSFCQGESITFSVSPNASYTYQWRKDNEDIANATSNTYTASEQGKYNLLIRNTNLCSISTPLVLVNVNAMPSKPSIVVENNNTLFCPGSIVKLMVPDSIAEISYQWKRSGIYIDGAENPSYKGKLSAGDYRVEAKLGECAVESDILTLNTKPAPAKPDIFAKGPNVWIVGCSNDKASDYTWYYNNIPIPGAKTHYYVANRNLGDYYVEIKEGNECTTKSDIINIPTGDIINDIPSLSEENILIFPNPTESQFNVTLGGTIKGLLYVDILNSTGRVMEQHQFADTDGFYINISDLPKGIYLCKIRHNGNVLVKKVVKQ
ncbi:MAG: PKD domain-containing protein [Bacteroidales bacterium]|nr:MAG: PKD domain-containing protein [Bacteroidales bacterium]